MSLQARASRTTCDRYWREGPSWRSASSVSRPRLAFTSPLSSQLLPQRSEGQIAISPNSCLFESTYTDVCRPEKIYLTAAYCSLYSICTAYTSALSNLQSLMSFISVEPQPRAVLESHSNSLLAQFDTRLRVIADRYLAFFQERSIDLARDFEFFASH